MALVRKVESVSLVGLRKEYPAGALFHKQSEVGKNISA
jgi:hypothetical protein